MHLKEFCGSWFEHQFWRSDFLIESSKDIQTLLASNIKEVWIDCSKGIDLEEDDATTADDDSTSELKSVPDFRHLEGRDSTTVSIHVELENAARICLQAKNTVISMFNDARMGKVVDIGGAKSLVDEIISSVLQFPNLLISLARLKTADDFTYMHSVAVCAMMVALAKQLNLDDEQIRVSGLAGLMHDLGKAMLPTDILNKPGKLSKSEFNMIKKHPNYGYQLLLDGANVDSAVLNVCLHHHEKSDGSGYPKGLKEDQISLFVRMASVCDVYDAITSKRPYKIGWDPAVSLRRMAEWTDGHLDVHVFRAFVKSVGIYPIGSLVQLTSGRLAIVIEQSKNSLLSPIVKVFSQPSLTCVLFQRLLTYRSMVLRNKSLVAKIRQNGASIILMFYGLEILRLHGDICICDYFDLPLPAY